MLVSTIDKGWPSEISTRNDSSKIGDMWLEGWPPGAPISDAAGYVSTISTDMLEMDLKDAVSADVGRARVGSREVVGET